MKRFVFILGLSLSILHAQTNWDKCDNTNSLYRYNDKWFGLESMKDVDMNGIPIHTFNSCSVYKYQFMDLSKATSAQLEGTLFTLGENKYMNISIGGVSIPVLYDCEGGSAHFAHGYLLGDNSGVTRFEHCDEYGYEIIRYNKNGDEINRTNISSDWIDKKGNAAYYKDHRNFIQYMGNNLIFSVTAEADPNKTQTLIFNLITHKITESPLKSAGFALTETGDLDGIFYLKEDKLNYKDLNSNNEFQLEENIYSKKMIAIVKGDRLIMATYNAMATGSNLFCYDLKTGKKEWIADVEQLSIPHFKYHNQVFLSMYNNRIILEGQESGGNYLQIFDVNTGKKVFSVVHKGK